MRSLTRAFNFKPVARGCGQEGFTLVELLVLIALVVVLISLLVPALAAVHRQSQTVQCSSNLRQLATALIIYGADHGGSLPPNVSRPGAGKWWHDSERVGRYLTASSHEEARAASRVLKCPADTDGVRSYAMNAWASSVLDRGIVTGREDQVWGRGARDPARLILLADTWSFHGSAEEGWVSPPVMGASRGTPGRRFGARGGTVIARNSRLGPINCELAYPRHALRSSLAQRPRAEGRVSIAYRDGHVAVKAFEQLVDVQTGRSSFDSFWTPTDHAQEQEP